MKFLYESDKILVLGRIDAIAQTINNRLLPTFDAIENEAREAGKRKLRDLSINFNPDFMDEGSVFDQAHDEEIYHYHLHSEMRKEFINSSATWLFHLFEKDCSTIFETDNGNSKVAELAKLSINTAQNSDWEICNTELRLIANVIKHGKGSSYNQLKIRKPQMIKSFNGFFSNAEIAITENDLAVYILAMKNFWSDLFKKALQFE